MIKVIYNMEFYDTIEVVYEFDTFEDCSKFFKEKYNTDILDIAKSVVVVQSHIDGLKDHNELTNCMLTIINLERYLDPNFVKFGSYPSDVNYLLREYKINSILD